jgi:2-furoyl-CoA dehydrogenase FAD binding subunit
VKPAQFEYFNPKTIDEAVSLLDQYAEDDGKILAGGQSLVPLMNFRLAKPKWLIDINGIEALDYVKDDGDWLAFGAIARERDVEKSVLVAEHCPLLHEVTRWPTMTLPPSILWRRCCWRLRSPCKVRAEADPCRPASSS